MKNPLERFKHRNIAKVATAYAVVGWLMLQMTEIVLPTFNAPQWIAQTIIFVVIMGFPIALLIAWASEVKAGNYKVISNNEEASASFDGNSTLGIPKKIFYGVAAVSLSIIGLFAFYVSTMLFRIEQSTGVQVTQTIGGLTAASAPIFRSPKFELNLNETGAHPGFSFRTEVALSPNGENLAFVSYTENGADIWIRDLLTLEEPQKLTSMRRGGAIGRPFFSSDGEWIYFTENGGLFRIRIEGGSAQSIGTPSFNWGAAEYDETVLSIPSSGVLTKSTILGETLSTTEQGTFAWPSFLPGGKHALVTRLNSRDSVQSARIEVVDLENMTSKPLIESAFNAKYASSGHLVFARDASLWAVPFDADSLKILGDQVPVLSELESDGRRGTAVYSFSKDGRLIYLRGTDTSGTGAGRILSSISRDGQRNDLEIDNQRYGHLNLSPDERDLSLTIYEEGGSDIWVLDLEREIFGRRTFDGVSSKSIWTADGNYLIYSSEGKGIWMVSANGTGQPQLVFPYDGPISPSAISEEGELVFSMGSPLKLYRISLNAEANPEREATELSIAPELVAWHGSALSADGEWLAYASQETGNNHVYVRPFPNVADGKWQASIESGFSPLWNPNKDELLYWAQNGVQVSVPFQVESVEASAQKSIRFSRPDELFSHNGVRSFETIKPWALSADRNLFYMITRPEDSDIEQRVLDSQTMLTVVENWFLELDSLAPPDPTLLNPAQ